MGRLTQNPVILQNVGDAYPSNCQVLAIIWESASTSGDTVLIDKMSSNYAPFAGRLWKGRTSDTQTYQGVNMGPTGISCPAGFVLTQISSGTVAVYLRET